MMEKITVTEFNNLPTFFRNGEECIELDGQVYNKMSVFDILLEMDMFSGL